MCISRLIIITLEHACFEGSLHNKSVQREVLEQTLNLKTH